MMDFRQRLEQSRTKPSNGEPPAEPEEGYECLYFATDRGTSPACLDLRLPEGSRKAVPYSYVTEISFDVEAGIEILTTQKRIRISGRNLGRLYDSLIAYRVRYIQANIGEDGSEDRLFVKAIIIEDLSY